MGSPLYNHSADSGFCSSLSLIVMNDTGRARFQLNSQPMNSIFKTIIAGVTAFAATNLDDIIVLMLFFARVSTTFRRRHIVTGQYLGFLSLIAASLPGFLGGMMIPKVWLGWLGLLPIAIGIHQLMTKDGDETVVQTTTLEQPISKAGWQARLSSILTPQTYQVAGVTIANGGDNIGIYVPLFANSTLGELVIILGVFLVMIGVWCLIAHYLAKHPLLSHALTHYGHRLVPFILIGLGIFIWVESGTYQLFLRSS